MKGLLLTVRSDLIRSKKIFSIHSEVELFTICKTEKVSEDI